MRLPPDWDAENSNGMFPYQMHLIHPPRAASAPAGRTTCSATTPITARRLPAVSSTATSATPRTDMSDIALTRADIEKVRGIADRKRDEWEGDEAAEGAAAMLIGFIDVLLGTDTLDDFLRDQDMGD